MKNKLLMITFLAKRLNTRLFSIKLKGKKRLTLLSNVMDSIIRQLTKMNYSSLVRLGAIDLLFCHLFGNEIFISVLFPQKRMVLFRLQEPAISITWRRLHPI